ncbi:MAG TPA: cardiolipin synthase ClsB [Rhodocyclaceae bacterium]|nr:cardiolipin synthase ClsB [Rhodocyclaceae bacterium]
MKPKFVGGNRLTLLNSGVEYFPALLQAIETAQQEIWLETYIFAKDAVGEAVAAALAAASRRGVQVRLLVDGFGAANFRADYAEPLVRAGVLAMEYRPEFGARFKRHRLRRLHRKLVVIDGKTAFVGGINIVDDNNAPPELRPRYDYAVKAEGPVIAQIHAAVRRMWEIVSWANLKHRYRLHHIVQPRCPPRGQQRAAFLLRDNIRHRNDIANAYLTAIHAAQSEVLIANAYFMPGFRFRHALRAAAQRGVKITILLQGPSDHPLLMYATRALYGALLDEGMRIFEYQRSFLHAKVAVIDNHWATIGSSNIDPFSLLLAKEGNLFIDDQSFTECLKNSLQDAMQEGARELRHEDWRKLGLGSRLLRWICYGAVRLLVGMSGFGAKHWQTDAEQKSA